MSDHCILMTEPRSGPQAESPEAKLLLGEGFIPVTSGRTGGVAGWVRHVWNSCPETMALDCEAIAGRVGLDLIFVDEDGNAKRALASEGAWAAP